MVARLAGDGRRKKSKTGEDDSYHTVQVGPGERGRKKSKTWIGYGLDLIWIEIGVLISRNELARPVMGTIFLVIVQNKSKRTKESAVFNVYLKNFKRDTIHK